MPPLSARARSDDRLRHLLVLLVVAISGNPNFTMGSPLTESVLIATSVLMTGLLLYRATGRLLHADFVLVMAAFGAILLLQSISFAFLPLYTIVGACLRIYVAYSLMRLSADFGRSYVNVMVLLGIVSLCFYVPDTLLKLAGSNLRHFFPPIGMYTVARYHHIGVHNFGDINFISYRNSGFFWEPGAFAGFLLLAMIFLALRRDAFTPSGYWKRLALLGACLLTTLSTMGYLVLPLALLLNFWPMLAATKSPAARLLPVVGAGVLVAGMVVAFQSLTFMEGKMSRQMEKVVGRDTGWEMTRMGSFLFDLEYIQRRPILGWGLHGSTRFSLHPGSSLAGKHGNGMSDFATKYGLAGVTVFLVMCIRGFYAMTGRHALKTLMILVMLFMVLTGETFLGASLFLSMMFLRTQPSFHESTRAPQTLLAQPQRT